MQPDDRLSPTLPMRTRRLAELGDGAALLLGDVLDAAPVSVVVMKEQDRVTWMNAEAERVFGWRLEELEERDLLAELIPNMDSRQRVRHLLHAGVQSWRTGTVHVRSGRRMECRWRTLPLSDGTVAILAQEDPVELPAGEGAAGHGVQSRQPQKLEAIGRFAGGIAHDFNNLLTAIRCGTELMLEELPAEASLRADLVDIQGATSRAAMLVRQLLAFSRRQVLRPVSVDLNVVVRDMEYLLRRIMGEDVEIASVLAADLPSVKADAAQMEQVIMNLAVNARDAMPEGGAFVITTERHVVAPHEQERHGIPAGSWARLTISDTGHGMDAATREQVFEPFFTTREESGGNGLGLSTVYGIVRQSEGLIDIHSELGRGTRFTIHFPEAIVDDDAAELEGVTAPQIDHDLAAAGRADSLVKVGASSVAPSGTDTLLLAEDDDAVRMLAARVLRSAGFQVLEAREGGEALELWRANTTMICALVTDLRMPGGGGLRLADDIRADQPMLPVVFMSGYSESAPDTLAGSAPMHFLPKPFTASELVGSVRDLLTPATS